ncbi:MAG: hypothetical protein LBD47_01065 [Treponema sp.]|nr:hypothetical protein [Treponema sp.]
MGVSHLFPLALFSQDFSFIGGDLSAQEAIGRISDIEYVAKAERGHWQEENKPHWHLDYTFYAGAEF